MATIDGEQISRELNALMFAIYDKANAERDRHTVDGMRWAARQLENWLARKDRERTEAELIKLQQWQAWAMACQVSTHENSTNSDRIYRRPRAALNQRQPERG